MNFARAGRLWGSIILLVTFFLITSYLAHRYEPLIRQSVQGGRKYFAIPIFFMACVVSVVLPPVASLPLIPVASQAWGGLATGLATASGWICGSLIAFYLARHYGRRFVLAIASRNELEAVQGYIPRSGRGLVGLLILLQIFLPVDLLSYAAGLFTRIPYGTFAFATAAGNVQSGLAFAYLGELPVKWQIVGFIVGGIIAVGGMHYLRTNEHN